MAVFWTFLTIGFIVLEALTAQLVSVWFAGGAFAALICAVCARGIWMQTVVFVAVSALLLFLTRRLVKKLPLKEPIKTNADALIGETGIVTATVSDTDAAGSVKIRGVTWSAMCEDTPFIKEGTYVIVKKIDGVKLIVSEKDSKEV